MTTRVLRLPEVEARTGYKRSSIYQKIKEGTFPPQIKIGARATAWIESEIETWVQDRIQENRELNA